MDGFKRPRRPINRNVGAAGPAPVPAPVSPEVPQPIASQPIAAPDLPPVMPDSQQEPLPPKKRSLHLRLWLALLGIMLLILAAIGLAGWQWLAGELKPLDSANQNIQRVEIKDGATFTYVAGRLEERGLIRSAKALEIYARLTGKSSKLQAGTCKLTPAESSQAILDKLVAGCHDFKSITFFPGATIEPPLYKPPHAELDQSTMNIKSVLSKNGYSDTDITRALGKTYDSPLFADKPAGSSLEGYVYGETYYVETDATAEQVLQKAFEQMYGDITKNKLVEKFRQQGLNLFQGITLASIVQRELNCEGKPTPERTERCYGYQQKIAQVFLKRLKEDMALGSDVTFIYAADQMKVLPRVDLDSPYNTRKYPGLPPGPIAAPGLHALLSVGNPSQTDYLFFIAGDDGLIYFAKTDAEHQANIKNHCQKLCNEL